MLKNTPQREEIPVVTLDGPGGSGKGTIGVLLAQELGWHFLDSGALYRVLALAALQQQISLTDEPALEVLAARLDVHFNGDIVLEGVSVNDTIRTEVIGNTASKIAVYGGVRAALLDRQRAFCKSPGLVADGRDMGTVVFPGANLKLFLEASAAERAKRRYLQLKDKGQSVTLASLLEEIEARDARDKGRVTAPLKPAEDAVVIDTTGLGIDEVFARVKTEVKRVFSKFNH